MGTPNEQRKEEQVALDNERKAFERRQKAFLAVHRQFYPIGNGSPATGDLNELDAADKSWLDAKAVVEKMVQEIRSGIRK